MTAACRTRQAPGIILGNTVFRRRRHFFQVLLPICTRTGMPPAGCNRWNEGEEHPEIMENFSPKREGAERIVCRLRAAGHEAFFVGGCVRDLLRGVSPDDYDIVTSARPEQVMALFSHTYPVGAAFGVVLVREGEYAYETATYRQETDYRDGRHPSRVSFVTAREDVLRRDFTVNGLLMDPVTGETVDYVGGREDLERRLIRTIGDPEARFAEDHLRMLRALRFAAQLDFTVDDGAWQAIKKRAGDINRVSAERIREELTRMLTGPGPRRGMELLQSSGLLSLLLPEIEALRGVTQPPRFHPEGDVWEHTLRMLALLPGEHLTEEAAARVAWAVLFHDAGKAETRTESDTGIHFYGHVQRGRELAGEIMKRFKFSREDMEAVLALVGNHMRFMHVREMRPHTLKKFLRLPDFDLHLLLHRLDCLGSHGLLDNEAFCRRKLEELTLTDLHPPRLLTGHDLLALGFPPGPLFRTILEMIEDAQLGGEISTAEEARALVRKRFSPTAAAGGRG